MVNPNDQLTGIYSSCDNRRCRAVVLSSYPQVPPIRPYFDILGISLWIKSYYKYKAFDVDLKHLCKVNEMLKT